MRRLIGNETRSNSQPTNLYERTQTMIRQQNNKAISSVSVPSVSESSAIIIIKNFPISLSDILYVLTYYIMSFIYTFFFYKQLVATKLRLKYGQKLSNC